MPIHKSIETVSMNLIKSVFDAYDVYQTFCLCT